MLKVKRKKVRYTETETTYTDYHEKPAIEPTKPMNKAQERYIKAIKSNIVTFGIGVSGSGKTHVAAGVAADMLREYKTEKIIITRPVCETGRNLGALPGELADKYNPYVEPLMNLLDKQLGVSFVRNLVKNGKIVIKPLEFMRGVTFDDCVVILDEAQNSTPEQVKMFLTRTGKNCKVIITGDTAQSDLRQKNGLTCAVDKLRNLDGVSVVEFTLDDIVRHGIVRDILVAWG